MYYFIHYTYYTLLIILLHKRKKIMIVHTRIIKHESKPE